MAAALTWWRKKRRDLAAPTLVEQVNKPGMTLTHYKVGSIKDRVGRIQDLVWKGVKDPQMRELALAITGHGEKTVKVDNRNYRVVGAGCKDRDAECEARAIYNWMKKNIRYTGDVGPVKHGRNGPTETVDYFSSPAKTVRLGGEDCDSHVSLNATLLALNGFTAKARVTAEAKNADWSHIYTVFGMPKNNPTKWVASDTTLPGDKFGVEAPYAKKEDYDA